MVNAVDPAYGPERVVSVVVVESNPLLRLGLRTAIATANGIRCVGDAGTAAALSELITSTRPDVLLVEARLLAAADDDSLSRRTSNGLAGEVLLYGGRVDDLIAIAPGMGPLGYIDKSGTPDEIIQAILELPRDRTAAECAEMAWRRRRMVRTETIDAGITRRELEILKLFADGLTNKQIARHLSVSETTVKFHSRNILQKLSSANRSQAVFKAVRTGMIRGA